MTATLGIPARSFAKPDCVTFVLLSNDFRRPFQVRKVSMLAFGHLGVPQVQLPSPFRAFRRDNSASVTAGPVKERYPKPPARL